MTGEFPILSHNYECTCMHLNKEMADPPHDAQTKRHNVGDFQNVMALQAFLVPSKNNAKHYA